MSDIEIPLPVTEEQLEIFCIDIIKDFSLPDNDDTRESIATLILHMPQSVASAPRSFFGNSVNKSRANAVAYAKMQEFAQKRKAAQAAALASNQVDTQPQVSTDEQQQSVQES